MWLLSIYQGIHRTHLLTLLLYTRPIFYIKWKMLDQEVSRFHVLTFFVLAMIPFQSHNSWKIVRTLEAYIADGDKLKFIEAVQNQWVLVPLTLRCIKGLCTAIVNWTSLDSVLITTYFPLLFDPFIFLRTLSLALMIFNGH